MRRLRDAVLLLLARVLLRAIPRLRLETVQRVGDVLGTLASWIPGSRKRRVRQHLEVAFPPGEYPEEMRRRLLGESYRHLAKIFLEAIWAPGWSAADDARMSVATPAEWAETLRLLHAQPNRGLVIYTAHLGTFEVLGKWMTRQLGRPLLAVASRPKHPDFEVMLRDLREKCGYKLVYRGDAGLATVRHLRRGGVLVVLVDHNNKGPGVEVPFLGRPAHTLLAPARLALQCGAVANTVFCLRREQGRLELVCDKPLVVGPLPAGEEAALAAQLDLIGIYTRRIEARIRQWPEQYLWMHKRWQRRDGSLPWPGSAPSPGSDTPTSS